MARDGRVRGWKRALVAAGGGLAVLVAVLASPGAGDEPVRGIVLVTLDTVRADAVDVGGAPGALATTGPDAPVRTPALARLAARGVSFRWAFSASACTAPSHASMLTGVYPSFHSVGVLNGRHVLDAELTTLAEHLAQEGWDTAAVVSNPNLAARVGMDQGFAVYDDRMEARELNRAVAERTADDAVDAALAWLDEGPRERPFFLWVHLQDAHGPYLPPPAVSCPPEAPGPVVLPVGEDHSGHQAIPLYQVVGAERDTDAYERRYGCEVRFVDAQLGRLLARLEEDPRLSRVNVAVTSDHGEAMGEDGFYFAHGHSVGVDQTHVPLVLAGPGLPEGELEVAPVSNVALFSTVLEWAGLPRPDDAVPSLLPLARGQQDDTTPVFVESINQVGLVVDGAFLRVDRFAADELDVWAAGNPNSGSFWKPLGAEVRRPLEEGGPVSVIPQDELWERLAGFDRRAARASARWDARRRVVPLGEADTAQLRALGYVR